MISIGTTKLQINSRATVDEKLSEMEIEGNFLNFKRITYQESTVNIMINVKQ